MPGLTHLKDIYEEKGLKFIQKLFSSNVYITEKIDGARFAFENNGDEILFYKRNPKNPISMVDRAVMKYYEPAIDHIDSLGKNKIPEGIRFGCEYFATKAPSSIVYDKKPKNNLILTDVRKGSSVSTDIDELKKYARQLKIDPPPVIFDGKLSKKQEEQIVEFLETDWEELYKKFDTQSFTAYIISILNPSMKSTALQFDINKPIEGVVFSFNDGKSYINAKIVDPLFTKKARERAKTRFTPEKKENNQAAKEFMKKVIDFIKSYDLSTIELNEEGKQRRYLELLSKVFKQFHLKNKSAAAKLPSVGELDNEMLDINYALVLDDDLSKMIKSNDKLKFGFKHYLKSFAKTRQRGNRILGKDMVSDVNSLVGTMRRLAESTDTIFSHLLFLEKKNNIK